jgi:hypothetical protein
MQRELAKHRDLQQHQWTSHELGQAQQVKEAQFSGAETIHCRASLWVLSRFCKLPVSRFAQGTSDYGDGLAGGSITATFNLAAGGRLFVVGG